MVVQGGARGASARRRTLGIAAGITAVAVIILGALSTVYTDVLWFREVGYSNVFWTAIWTKVALGGAFGAAFALLLLINLWIARRITSPARLFTVPDQILERYRATLQPYMKSLVIGGAIVFGIFAGSGATVRWQEFLLFRNAVDVGQVDPVFQRDIGFFLFKLPFYQFLFTWLFSTLIVTTIVTGVAHYFMGGIRPQARGDRVAPEVRAHLSVLLGLIVLLKAWGYRLDQFELLYSPRGQVTGASYTDVHAQLPALRLLVIIAVLCAVFFLINARFKNWVLPIAGIGLLALMSIVAGGIYPAAIQRFRVTPNELLREREFIERNIRSTRHAFGVSDVELRPLPADEKLTVADLDRNAATVENIRLWDPNILRLNYRSLQRIKPFYEFLDVDVDRYTIAGEKRQVMLSAREIGLENLDSSARTWLNTHLAYTHGYGVVATRVDRSTADGQPVFLLKDAPPVASEGAPAPESPQIYFGEGTEQPFVVVRTDQPETDYPQEGKGEEFATNQYDGPGGIQLSGALRRAAFAWRFRDVNLLISGAIKPESKILIRRNVDERVREIAPFLKLDHDPYVVIANKRVKWILDAYTTSSMWPYAERVNFFNVTDGNLNGSGNYIRNSVKFVIDAKDGTIDAYQWDAEDPMLKAWAKAYPNFLKPKEQLPPELLEHVRYPEAMFQIQTDRFANYHVENVNTFYSKGDAWLVANDPTLALNQVSAFSRAVVPYYVLMKLPGEKGLNFVLVRPFTPGKRQNLASYMVAHGDPDQYGRLVAYTLPRGSNVLGPELVQSRINNEPAVSQYITLNSEHGSRVLYGNLIIVPIEKSLLYVQPLYVQGSGSALPELKRVVAVFGERVEMSSNLRDALAAIFGKGAKRVDDPEPEVRDIEELVRRADSACEAADTAAKAGDLEEFGRQYARCRRLIDQAAERSSPNPIPAPS